MIIKEFDTILLKDGRKGAVVMTMKDKSAYEVDFGDYEEVIEIHQIEKVI